MVVYEQLVSTTEFSDVLRVDSPYHRYILAIYFSSGSTPIGQAVKTVTLNMKKHGSPTGTLYIRAYTFSGVGAGTLNHTWGSIDISTMDNTAKAYTVTGTNYTLQTDDCVGAYMDAGSSTSASNYIAINGTGGDLSPIQAAEYETGGSWGVQPNTNPYAILSGDTPSGGSGTRLPPPPIVLGGL